MNVVSSVNISVYDFSDEIINKFINVDVNESYYLSFIFNVKVNIYSNLEFYSTQNLV